MNGILKVFLLILLGGIVPLASQGCFHSSYIEFVDDHFYTFDRERAQEEIPFPIIMPGYIPKDEYGYTPKGLISGPTKEHQTGDGVEVSILYQVFDTVTVTGSMTIPYKIYEYNYPVLPPAAGENHDLAYTEIDGIDVIRSEVQEQPICYYFEHDGTYFLVESYGIPDEEAYKMIESMIGQF